MFAHPLQGGIHRAWIAVEQSAAYDPVMYFLATIFGLGFVLLGALGIVVAAVIGPETAQTFWGLSILCFITTSILAVLNAIF